MNYCIRLVGLECFRAEEIDGDEVYVKLNGTQVWTAQPDKMSIHLEHDHHVSQYDFAGGRKHTGSGWLPLTPYDPNQFVFSGQSGRSTLELWDGRLNTLLGETPIDAVQASGGNISVVFQRAGAHYRMTYKVEVES